MPSRLVTNALNRLATGRTARRQLQAAVQEATPGVQPVEVRGPFLGYTPDLDPNLTDGTAFDRLVNVLARAIPGRGEVLQLPDGYRQLDLAAPNNRLPLGDRASLPATPLSDADPVVRLDQVGRTAPTGHGTPGELAGEFQLTPMAVTSGDGTTNLSGNMYRIAANGQWTHVEEAAAVSDARALKAGRDGRTQSPCMPDSCVAPFGATARATTTAAPGDDGQSGAIQEPAWIFTNDVDEVMVFPSSTVETLAAAHRYEPLTGVAALDSGGANGFRAKSCETWNGRVYFLNTSEAGTRRQRRLRRTAKFTADPDPAIVGSGFWDFPEFQGEGLRCETLGDVLAVYFSDGIAFMRATGVPTAPDEPQIISTERGLLATHAVVPIGRNTHFGIFTDRWWLLDQSCRFEERGVVNINGKVVPKWRQTFYDGIPSNQRHRVYCYYDQPNNLVYIARPTAENPEPREVWIYDPTSDRVFIENYPVTCFGTFSPQLQAGVAIDSVTSPIDSVTLPIDSFGPVAGFPKARVHGDQTGFVYVHRRDISGFHSAASPTPVVQNPSWAFRLGMRALAGMSNLVTVDRVSLEYFNRGNTNAVSVEVAGPSADGTQNRTGTLAGGALGNVRTRDFWFRYTSQQPGLTVSGVGDYQVRAVTVDAHVDPVEPRGL